MTFVRLERGTEREREDREKGSGLLTPIGLQVLNFQSLGSGNVKFSAVDQSSSFMCGGMSNTMGSRWTGGAQVGSGRPGCNGIYAHGKSRHGTGGSVGNV